MKSKLNLPRLNLPRLNLPKLDLLNLLIVLFAAMLLYRIFSPTIEGLKTPNKKNAKSLLAKALASNKGIAFAMEQAKKAGVPSANPLMISANTKLEVSSIHESIKQNAGTISGVQNQDKAGNRELERRLGGVGERLLAAEEYIDDNKADIEDIEDNKAGIADLRADVNKLQGGGAGAAVAAAANGAGAANAGGVGAAAGANGAAAAGAANGAITAHGAGGAEEFINRSNSNIWSRFFL